MNRHARKGVSPRSCAVVLVFLGAFGCHWASVGFAQEKAVTIVVHPDRVVNQIDVKVYGHFLEHIYHSVNGGLWGELVWNRSFEHNDAGQWRVEGDTLVQRSRDVNRRWVFGDPGWQDYEFTLEAQKIDGEEGFLILFRVRDNDNFYWCNLGGWGNRWHQLERGRSGEGRWYPVGPRVSGQIERNRWYKIRIRCEGPHIQVWLDEQKIIDFTDREGHLAGAVGIGTWATRARFRNLRVTDLEGRVLFSGIPDSSPVSGLARHWEAFGQGRVSLDDESAANSQFSVKIEGAPGETGIQQTPFALKANEWYVGSLWIRGTTEQAPVVRLMDGVQPLAMQSLPWPSEKWQEVPLRLRAIRNADNATLQIALRGPGTLWVDQVSLMPESWKQNGGFRPDLLQAVAELKPPLIRWPGGCFASAYRWKSGIGPQSNRVSYPREIWDDVDVNSFGTDEFIQLCRRVGAEPCLVVNIGTPQWNPDPDPEEFLQDILDWIEYCNGPADSKWGRVRAANGHPEPYHVKYWEIDNETWGLGAENYAAAVRKIAPLMRAKDPSIKLIACGSGGMGESAHRWNRVIIEQCADLIDYLSLHHYENPDQFARGPYRYEAFFEETAKVIAQSRNPHLKLFVSEWNAQSTDWRTGLYCGGILNAFERTGGVVEIASPALFLRHISATAWDNAFINFDHRRWFPAPNYVVMKLWRDNFAPERIAVEGVPEDLNLVATRDPQQGVVIVKVVNPGRESRKVSIQVAGQAIQSATAQKVAPGDLRARNTLDRPDAVRPEKADVALAEGAATVELPALSCVVVRLSVK